jgi:phage gpG-like protein
MKIGASINNYGVLQAKLQELQNAVFIAPAQEVLLGALEIQTDAKRSIAEHQSSLRTETRYNPKREQEVSEPGHAPNSDLGKLAQSVEVDFDPEKVIATTGTNLLYGKSLELGTAKMAARPWLFPAFQRNVQKIRDNIARALQSAIQGSKDAG